MRHIFIAAAALIAGLMPFSVQAKHASAHRIEISPGFSLTVPDGFASCDASINKQLGNAPHVLALEKDCAQVSRLPGAMGLFNMDFKTPVILVSVFVRAYTVPEELAAGATPEIVAVFNRDICERMISSFVHARDCHVHAAKLAGHDVFAIEGTTASGGRNMALRGYILSRDASGTQILMFTTALPQQAKAQALMEAVIGSLTIAPAPPPSPPELVRLTPLRGMSVGIPKGWIACDPASNVLLGSVQDISGVSQSCSQLAGKGARFANPRLPNITLVDVMSLPAKIDSEAFAKTLTPDALAARHDADCLRMKTTVGGDGVVVGDCSTEAGSLGGHPAKITEIAATTVEGGLPLRMRLRSTYIVLNGRVMGVNITVSSPLTPKIEDAAEAVEKSVTFP